MAVPLQALRLQGLPEAVADFSYAAAAGIISSGILIYPEFIYDCTIFVIFVNSYQNSKVMRCTT